MIATGGIVMLMRTNNEKAGTMNNQTNVRMEGEKQVIMIKAKGGYAPRSTTAQANVASTIQVETNGTYDCSLALSVPSVGFREMLPDTGVTSIELPPQKTGSTVKGVCSMGMYSFTIRFL